MTLKQSVDAFLHSGAPYEQLREACREPESLLFPTLRAAAREMLKAGRHRGD